MRVFLFLVFLIQTVWAQADTASVVRNPDGKTCQLKIIPTQGNARGPSTIELAKMLKMDPSNARLVANSIGYKLEDETIKEAACRINAWAFSDIVEGQTPGENRKSFGEGECALIRQLAERMNKSIFSTARSTQSLPSVE